MIFYWVLITYAFVNVSALVCFEDYMKEVDIATQLIEGEWNNNRAFVNTVKRIILGKQYEFLQLNFMFAVPEYVKTDNITEDVTRCQTLLQDAILRSYRGVQRPTPRPDHLTDATAHGIARREIITAAIKIIFERDVPCRTNVYSDEQVCYLIALGLQKQYGGQNCITNVEARSERCIFMDYSRRERQYYMVNREYWEHWVIDPENRSKRLLDQLVQNITIPNSEITIPNPEITIRDPEITIRDPEITIPFFK